MRVPVLGVVKLLPHHVIQRRTLKVKYLLKRFPKVSVQRCVDDRVQKGVGVAEPEEETREGPQDGGIRAEEGPHECEDEERQPANGESTHDDPESGRGLPLLGQLEPDPFLTRRSHQVRGGLLPGGGRDRGGRRRGRQVPVVVPRLPGGLPVRAGAAEDGRLLRLVRAPGKPPRAHVRMSTAL